MGIADEIKKTIQSKLLLKYHPSNQDDNQSVLCVICNHSFNLSGNLSFYIPDDGYVCYSCGQNFAPEMALALTSIGKKSIEKPESQIVAYRSTLSSQEWIDIHNNLEILHRVTLELSKGLSRGIIEAPSGHIGLLHYAKDIVRPAKKDGESDKNYELRVKTYRMRKIFENLKKETTDRIEILQKYLIKLGVFVSKDLGNE